MAILLSFPGFGGQQPDRSPEARSLSRDQPPTPTPEAIQQEFSRNREARLPPPRTLPDPSICRAKNSGFAAYADYADCLVESPCECPHALRFGMRYFCHHPERGDIVTRTASNPSV